MIIQRIVMTASLLIEHVYSIKSEYNYSIRKCLQREFTAKVQRLQKKKFRDNVASLQFTLPYGM